MSPPSLTNLTLKYTFSIVSETVALNASSHVANAFASLRSLPLPRAMLLAALARVESDEAKRCLMAAISEFAPPPFALNADAPLRSHRP
jgi:hypothetical protein